MSDAPDNTRPKRVTREAAAPPPEQERCDAITEVRSCYFCGREFDAPEGAFEPTCPDCSSTEGDDEQDATKQVSNAHAEREPERWTRIASDLSKGAYPLRKALREAASAYDTLAQERDAAYEGKGKATDADWRFQLERAEQAEARLTRLLDASKRFLDSWDEFDGPPLTPQDTFNAVSESVEGLRSSIQAEEDQPLPSDPTVEVPTSWPVKEAEREQS